MTKTQGIFIIGVLVAILPYLGLPASWKNIVFTILGVGLAFFAYLFHRDSERRHAKRAAAFENFSENSNFGERGMNQM